MKTVKAPIECKTEAAIRKLPMDNFDLGDCWLLVGEGEITLGQRKKGYITVRKAAFDALIHWYQTGIIRAIKPKKRGRAK